MLCSTVVIVQCCGQSSTRTRMLCALQHEVLHRETGAVLQNKALLRAANGQSS